MEKIEKIISTNSSGEINDINYYTFEYIYDKKSDEINSCEDRDERLRLMVDLADFCVECHEERRAVGIYRDMLRFGGCSAYRRDSQSATGASALHAYEALLKLAHSDDEFIWEESSQALDIARSTFAEQP